ncbi:MAG: hypothetical protein ACI9V8_000550 [Urechidicola sp.]|jgi:hypothetical protein
MQYRVMSPKKATTLNLRVKPNIKEAIREAANRDHRSIANMIEILIRKYSEDVGISIPEQNTLFPGDNSE